MTRIGPLFWTSSLLLFSIVAAAESDIVAKVNPNVVILNEVLSNMDESVEPCGSFQNYSVKNIKPLRLPPILPEFITLFEELNNQTFEEGSLERKVQRVYNICLVSRLKVQEPQEILTLQELEDRFQVSLADFLNYYYGRYVSPSSVVYIENLDYVIRLKLLLEKFNASDLEYTKEIVHSFEVALRFPADCADFVAVRMGLAVNLLFEERFLGSEKLNRLQSKVEKIFEAIRQQINISLQRNPLNWTMPEIEALQENINNLTLRVGGIPKNVNRRDFVTKYYEGLDFSDEDDMTRFATQKFTLWRMQKNPEFRTTKLNTVTINKKLIVVSYLLLANSTFELESHDLFQMTPLGILLAFYMLNSYKPSNCKEYNNTPYNTPHWEEETPNDALNQFCWKLYSGDKSLAKQHTILLLLDLVHKAYFAADSNFNQSQPSFTTKPLSQLSFLRLAQTSTHLFGLQTELLDNLLPVQPSFVQAFDCPDFM
ncbi:uncharacterized protein [Drosophila takahashii]|uniref:uncharacterized protein n=1 Tax=Drosophila takahashii TaxID=29030 RepID=UPI001CF858C1|nr:uncharacterized protein LOC108061011 [Drosophila takahashii]